MTIDDGRIHVVLRGGPCDGEVLSDQPPIEFCPEYSELGWKYRRTGEFERVPGDEVAPPPYARLWIYEWVED